MKRVLWAVLATVVIFSGCVSSNVVTDMGATIAKHYDKALAKGIPTAEQIVKAWPYVSGLVRGCMGEEYEFRMPPSVTWAIDELDALCAKTELTTQDKGTIVGLAVRVEYLAGKAFWDKYGDTILGKLKMIAMGGV